MLALPARGAARTTAFDQKPFHHLLLCILSDLYDVVGEDMVLQMADVLVAVQPRMVPAFTFSWLELVSHRALMPKLLQMPRKRGWAALADRAPALSVFVIFRDVEHVTRSSGSTRL